MRMLEPLSAAALNHLLHAADWARARLAPFHGATIRVVVPPTSSTYTVADDGTLRADAEAEPAATITLSPAVAFRLLVLKDDTARAEIDVQGDAALAGALTRVLASLEWDAEEDLSRVVGDVAAHRIAGAARSLANWHRELAGNLSRAAGEYLTEERPVIASPSALRDFAAEVDALRDDTERLGKRIERLARGRG
jgi:ubiquinone biosynthesis protein UbiJ